MRTGECTWLERRHWIGVLALTAVLAGCGEAEIGRGRVHGTVTLNGQPLPQGRIRFFPVSDGVGSDGEIKDGKYDISADRGLSAGKYRVEISAEKATGRKVPDLDAGPGDMKEEVVETIPPAFNRDSTLQVDFDPAQDAPHDFAVGKK